MKQIKLNWFGPYRFLGKNSSLSDIKIKDRLFLSGPGVYIIRFPLAGRPPSTGFYIGKADCLIQRYFDHVGYYFSGDYSLHKKIKGGFDYEKIARPENLNEVPSSFRDFLKKSWKEIENSDYFFATVEGENLGENYLYHIEFALIRKFQSLTKDITEGKKIIVLQTGQGGRKGEEVYQINNHGNLPSEAALKRPFNWFGSKEFG